MCHHWDGKAHEVYCSPKLLLPNSLSHSVSSGSTLAGINRRMAFKAFAKKSTFPPGQLESKSPQVF